MPGLDYLGLLPLSLSDFPGRRAATIFTAGCPLACPYCHNPGLIKQAHPGSFLPRGEVLDFLRRRVGLLDGVAITGGEPTLHTGLLELIREIGRLGFPVKLDTAGVFPRALERLLREPWITYVALDIKTSPDLYYRVGGNERTGKCIRESLELLRGWKNRDGTEPLGFETQGVREEPRILGAHLRTYELRTVCAPGIVDEQVLKSIHDLLEPHEPWTLTRFRPGGCLNPEIEKLPRVEEWVIQQFERSR